MRLRSRSAAFVAAESVAEGGADFFFAASNWAWVGGFGGGLWVCVPVRITEPLTNLYPSGCTQTPLASVQPCPDGAAGATLDVASDFVEWDFFCFAGGSACTVTIEAMEVRAITRKILRIISDFEFLFLLRGKPRRWPAALCNRQTRYS